MHKNKALTMFGDMRPRLEKTPSDSLQTYWVCGDFEVIFSLQKSFFFVFLENGMEKRKMKLLTIKIVMYEIGYWFMYIFIWHALIHIFFLQTSSACFHLLMRALDGAKDYMAMETCFEIVNIQKLFEEKESWFSGNMDVSLCATLLYYLINIFSNLADVIIIS